MKEEIKLKTIRVSHKGQIAIPADIRRDLNIREGEELLLVKKGERIMLEKPKEFAREIEEEFKDLLMITESSLKKLWLNKEDEIWNQYLKRDKK